MNGSTSIASPSNSTACCPESFRARGHRVVRDQLERASLSVVLNIAEGAGRISAPDKRRFYVAARGSATECAAVLDVLRLQALIELEQFTTARSLLIRLVQMLSRLAQPAGNGS